MPSPVLFSSNGYTFGAKLSSGGFGEIFEAVAPDGGFVAVKKERALPTKPRRTHLAHEAQVYKVLAGLPCVARLRPMWQDGEWDYLPMDLLGESVEDRFRASGSSFSLETTLVVGVQMLKALECIHSRFIVHRDVKPDNFVFGRGQDEQNLFIVDFGLSRRYRHPHTFEHAPFREGGHFAGTSRFASLSAHEGNSQSRRDDLESLAYCLIYLFRGSLPWQKPFGGTARHRRLRILEKKRSWTPARLCKDLPEEIEQFFQYCRDLAFDADPDYEHLESLLKGALIRRGNVIIETPTDEINPVILPEIASKPIPPAPYAAGDFVLLRVSARDTLEYEPVDSPSDPSYWHDPVLTTPEWLFPYRPAVLLSIDYLAAQQHFMLQALPLLRPQPPTDPKEHGIIPLDPAAVSPEWEKDRTYVNLTFGPSEFALYPNTTSTLPDLPVSWRMKPQQLDHFRTLASSGNPVDSLLGTADPTPYVVEAAPLTLVDDHVDWTAVDGWNFEMSVIAARRVSENLEVERQSHTTLDWRCFTENSSANSPNDDSIQSA